MVSEFSTLTRVCVIAVTVAEVTILRKIVRNHAEAEESVAMLMKVACTTLMP